MEPWRHVPLRPAVLALVSWLFRLTLVLIVFASSAGARTWHVPGDAPRIQAAIDSAHAGDDVLLAPGTYRWTSEAASQFSMLTSSKPGLTLHSEAGAETTVLDGQSKGRLLRCQDVGQVLIE